jgi:hypothetical protein
MKTINLNCNRPAPEKLAAKIAEIESGGGRVTKLTPSLIYFDVPRTYPNLGPQALEKFDRQE